MNKEMIEYKILNNLKLNFCIFQLFRKRSVCLPYFIALNVRMLTHYFKNPINRNFIFFSIFPKEQQHFNGNVEIIENEWDNIFLCHFRHGFQSMPRSSKNMNPICHAKISHFSFEFLSLIVLHNNNWFINTTN